jgi:phosphoserine aminotransferase
MISFYPGPSKVWDSLPHYMHDAWQQGILSVNHRSAEFMEISRETLRLLHEKLEIPADYSILFTSSATECWEIIAQSVLGSSKSLHLYSGAFGEKWHEYTHKITHNAHAYSFSPDELPAPAQLNIDQATSLIALTHNETSNGSALPDSFMQELRSSYPEQLIAVDATSSMAGVRLPFASADIWYASVQKCFGLPAGLGLLICSPKAIDQARSMAEERHYNSLLFMLEKIADAQTPYTPNVLGIYLLMRSLQDRPGIEATADQLHKRYTDWLAFLEAYPALSLLIKNPVLRSRTVLTIESSPEKIEKLKKAAKAKGLYLGNGYGPWKGSTFRIANFPALREEEIQQLKDFLSSYSH